jgi:glutaredoxin
MKRWILTLFILSSPVFAGVYKWTDENGRIHYSDTPPATVKASKLKLQSHTGPVQVSKAVDFDQGVTLYTASWCGVCKRAKAFLRERNIPFTEWDVEKTDYGAYKYRELGGQGVPLITLGSKVMTGFDPDAFLQLWRASQARP